MLIQHRHQVVGQALKDVDARARREARALAFIRKSHTGVTSGDLAAALKMPVRSARRMLAGFYSRGLIEPAGDFRRDAIGRPNALVLRYVLTRRAA